jgi:hypothetical protein
VEEPTPMDISLIKERSLKGKKLAFSPPVVVGTIKFRRPFTRLAAKKHVPMEDGEAESSAQQKDKSQNSKYPIDIIYINTPPHEINPTFKRLRRQLKEARTEIDKLKKEDLETRIKLKDILDLH